MERSYINILIADHRQEWVKVRTQLQQISPQNAATIETIKAVLVAFTVSLDEATPTTATQRSRQFHFGGDNDAANRWHDKSIQFAVCSNGVSGTISEHTMIDALTLDELNEGITNAISSAGGYSQKDRSAVYYAAQAIVPVLLPMKTTTALEAHIHKVQARYADSIKDAEHVYFIFHGYGSKWLRSHKLPPKSVFQMNVQLAAHSTLGYTPPCWETVNHAHYEYHLGRVDIVQVITPQVAVFLVAVVTQLSARPSAGHSSSKPPARTSHLSIRPARISAGSEI